MPRGNELYGQRVGVRLPPDDAAALRALADRNREKLSQTIREAVKFYLAAIDQETKREELQQQ